MKNVSFFFQSISDAKNRISPSNLITFSENIAMRSESNIVTYFKFIALWAIPQTPIQPRPKFLLIRFVDTWHRSYAAMISIVIWTSLSNTFTNRNVLRNVKYLKSFDFRVLCQQEVWFVGKGMANAFSEKTPIAHFFPSLYHENLLISDKSIWIWSVILDTIMLLLLKRLRLGLWSV